MVTEAVACSRDAKEFLFTRGFSLVRSGFSFVFRRTQFDRRPETQDFQPRVTQGQLLRNAPSQSAAANPFELSLIYSHPHQYPFSVDPVDSSPRQKGFARSPL